jgi:phage-related protein
MTTPTKLSGAASTIKIDGTDLHTYGMIVNVVSNPVPGSRQVTVSVDGLDGDLDYTKNIGPRTISLSGSIIGNNHSDLVANIDYIKSFFRLRENGDNLQLIFQDQTDRYWTVRYLGGLQVAPNGLWMYSKTASFSLQLKCVRPYSEATSMTSESLFLHCLKDKIITYAGTIRTPLNIELIPRFYENILEKDAGDCNQDNTLWAYTNATGSDSTTYKIYGTRSVKVTRTAGGVFSVQKSLTLSTSIIDVTKNYVFGAYGYFDGAQGTKNCTLKATITGGNSQSSAFQTTYFQWGFAFVKISAAQMAGASAIYFKVENDGTDANFYIDGCFAYEITAAEFSDATYFPPPYMSDPSGDDYAPPKNPIITLHRSRNVVPWQNGEYTAADWGGDSGVPANNCGVVSDPLGGPDKCLLFRTAASAGSFILLSPKIYLTGGKTYRITFDYYLEYTSGAIGGISVFANFYGYADGDNYTDSCTSNFGAAGSAWATKQLTWATLKAVNYCRIRIVNENDVGVKFFIKNIQIVEEIAPAESYAAYDKPDIKNATYTGTLDQNDSLIIDSDKVVADLYDHSALSVANAMANLVMNPLLLEPGTNTLRYQDARKTAAAPESESCGSIMAKLDYRARYL